MRTLDKNYIKRTLSYHMGYGWSTSRNHSTEKVKIDSATT